MTKQRVVLGALALGAAGFAAGLWTGSGAPPLPDGLLALVRPAAAQSQRRPAQDDPILFYRDPMGERAVSPGPRKDSMGMDFLPVYPSQIVPLLPPLTRRGSDAGDPSAPAPRAAAANETVEPVPPATAAATARRESGERRILYYRNPMGLPDVSPVPKKDSMGMDYIPVYSDEATDDGSVGISPARLQTLGVRTEPAERRILARTIRAVGTVAVDERRQATVTSRFEGWIERLHANETGRDVARGEPLMEVYSPELLRAQSDYLAGQATRRPGDPDVGRMRLLNLGLSEAQIDAIRAAGRATRTLTIPAPIAGTVLAKTALQGMMFRPGDPLFSLADLSAVAVMTDVYEQDAGALRAGQPATVTIAAFPGESFQGVVDRIYPALETATRTARVRVMLSNPERRLRLGMLATVEIAAPVADGREVVAVPAAAVLDGGRRRVVLVELGGGRFRPAEVRTGARAGGRVEILEGLSGDERVVVGANFLIDAESNMRSALAAFTAAAPGEGVVR